MNYKIIGFNPATGSAQVRFYTAEWTEGLVYSIDIPHNEGAYISGNELDNHVMAFAPFGQISNLVALRDRPPSHDGIVVDFDILVPPVVSFFQGCAALQAGGYLDPVEAYMAGPASAVEKLAWRTITEIRRASPLTSKLALMLVLTEQQVDELFILAATIEA